MKRFTTLTLFVLSFAPAMVGGCSREVAHTEQDKPNLLGGRTHEETTTYKNPDGTYTTEKSKTKTSN
jgi:hypothetical protein